jgi:hypothetical protein
MAMKNDPINNIKLFTERERERYEPDQEHPLPNFRGLE